MIGQWRIQEIGLRRIWLGFQDSSTRLFRPGFELPPSPEQSLLQRNQYQTCHYHTHLHGQANVHSNLKTIARVVIHVERKVWESLACERYFPVFSCGYPDEHHRG